MARAKRVWCAACAVHHNAPRYHTATGAPCTSPPLVARDTPRPRRKRLWCKYCTMAPGSPRYHEAGVTCPLATGVVRITQERERQVRVEKFDAGHDDGHRLGELAAAAACYAASAGGHLSYLWPTAWDRAWDRRSVYQCTQTVDDRIRDLEKAGALCAAEIDRLLRSRGRG